HRAVGGVLLVGLDTPRIVEDVEVIQDDALLNPLAAGVIPVRQPIDDHVVLAGLAQLERLDGDALDVEEQRVALPGNAKVEPLEHVLEAERPAEVGPERQSDATRDLGHAILTRKRSSTAR